MTRARVRVMSEGDGALSHEGFALIAYRYVG